MPDAAAGPPASLTAAVPEPAPGPGARPAAAAPGARAESAPAPASQEPPAPADPRETDRRFSALVLAVGPLREGEPDAAQRDVLQRLEEMIRGAPDRHLVPRMPALLPRLLGLVRRADVSTRELAEPLTRDPALLGEVIRLANSPRYRTLRAISSVQEAILLLGQRGLEQLLVRVVMGPVFDGRQGPYSRAAGTRVWDQAERCAHACAWLRRGAHDGFEAYLAGMVANSGLMVALRVLDRHLGDAKAPDTTAFHDALLDASGRLSVLIARQWNFPAAVVAALETRPHPETGVRATEPATEEGALASALRAADRASKRLLLAAAGHAGTTAQGEDEAACDVELRRAFGA
jgi:HD-like signal output (HDOD) protein